MANTNLNPGAGPDQARTLERSASVKTQVVALDVGGSGGPESIAGPSNPVPVAGTVALDAAALAAIGQGLTNAQLRAAAVPVSGTFWQTTQPISAAALPLPAGAATEARLTALETLLTTIAGTIKNHNDPFVDGTPGQVMLGKRRDSDTTSVADGDLNTLNMDEEGRLKVASKPASYTPTTGNVTSATSTVFVNTERFSNLMIHCTGTFAGVNCTFEGSLNSTNGTDGTWFAVQAIRSNANTVETTTGVLAAAPAYAWELSVNAMKWFRIRATAWTSGTQVWTMTPGTYATEPIPAAQVSGTQPVSGTVTANVGTLVTPTASNINSAATTNATSIKTSAGTVYSIVASNTNAAVRYVKLYNKASAPTVGTDVPVLTIPVPAGGAVTIPFGQTGHRFTTGIALAITAGAADSDTAAVAANEIKVLTAYI